MIYNIAQLIPADAIIKDLFHDADDIYLKVFTCLANGQFSIQRL
jgi:hypothetical protein